MSDRVENTSEIAALESRPHAPAQAPSDQDPKPGEIQPHEERWCKLYNHLESLGFRLRPRYKPGWKPSWQGTDKNYLECEDGYANLVSILVALL
jgi:hypothetical protein